MDMVDEDKTSHTLTRVYHKWLDRKDEDKPLREFFAPVPELFDI